jgi:hypothetical protein
MALRDSEAPRRHSLQFFHPVRHKHPRGGVIQVFGSLLRLALGKRSVFCGSRSAMDDGRHLGASGFRNYAEEWRPELSGFDH